MSRAIFQKIANSKASMGGNGLRDGIYTLVVEKMICEAKHKGEFFIPEFLVVESAPTQEGKELSIAPNEPGSHAADPINLDKESGPGNAKALVLALLGLEESSLKALTSVPGLGIASFPPDSKDADKFVLILDAMLVPGQPMRGKVVKMETFRKPIQKGPNAGKPFVAKRYSYVMQTDAQILENRNDLDGNDKAEKAAK